VGKGKLAGCWHFVGTATKAFTKGLLLLLIRSSQTSQTFSI
jgi:hypothetical protein